MIKNIGIVVFVVVAGIGLGKVIREPIANLMGTKPSERSSIEARPTPALPPVATPPSGVLENYAVRTEHSSNSTVSGRLRLFSARPKASDSSGIREKCPEREDNSVLRKQHYFVRVSNWNSNQMVMTAFIRAGDYVTLNLPFGLYRIRYATGLQWYGEKHLFGEDTRYIELTERDDREKPLKVEFSQTKGGLDIALFPCGTDGNMNEQPIDPDKF